jgi:hypothetical protein
MQVYVLEGRIDYEGGCVYGVYSTRELAEAAGRAEMRRDTLGGITFVVHEVGVDAAADARILYTDQDCVCVAA